jgi:hypothetical protein
MLGHLSTHPTARGSVESFNFPVHPWRVWQRVNYFRLILLLQLLEACHSVRAKKQSHITRNRCKTSAGTSTQGAFAEIIPGKLASIVCLDDRSDTMNFIFDD